MKGPGTKEQQIQSLRSKVGNVGVSNANTIVGAYEPNVIALAYKLTRKVATLPKSVTNLLENLPTDEADEIRSRLLSANGVQS